MHYVFLLSQCSLVAGGAEYIWLHLSTIKKCKCVVMAAAQPQPAGSTAAAMPRLPSPISRVDPTPQTRVKLWNKPSPPPLRAVERGRVWRHLPGYNDKADCDLLLQ